MAGPLVFVCQHVFRAERDVELVVHHRDGRWQFTCGKFDHEAVEGALRPVHLEHLIERQPDLHAAVEGLPAGELVERDSGNWSREIHDD